MTQRLARLPAPLRTAALTLSLLLAAAPAAWAQPQEPATFPREAMRFLDAELPPMNAAVAARDRGYFEGAMARTVEFSERWGFKTHTNAALSRYAACTDAVSDHLVVGLCRISGPNESCEPGLGGKFEANLRACKAMAGPG